MKPALLAEVIAVMVAGQARADLRRQTIEATPHVDGIRADKDPNGGR